MHDTSLHILSPPTLAQSAKNKDMSLWAWENIFDESSRDASWTPFIVSSGEIPGSETWEALVDVSALST